MRSEAFFESSQKIVKKFLSNVVTIDDKLFFKNSAQKPPNQVDDNFDAIEEDSSGMGTVDPSTVNPLKKFSDKQDHALDYQNLSLAFAEYGINCSGFIPDPSRFKTIDEASTKIMESARRADITILDWHMDQGFPSPNVAEKVADTGSLAKASIKKILEQDKEQHGRLRLMIIYTAEPDREGIAEAVHQLFANLTDTGIQSKREDCSITFETSGLELCKIVVIEKKPSAEDLREEVIALFTELTTGLLSNATLAALGELRDNTHHILHTFNKHLDPAYISHVLGLLSSPEVREKAHEVAFDYATDLISEEFKSSLQINDYIKTNLGNERLQDWVDFVCTTTTGKTIGIKLNGKEPILITSTRFKNLLAVTTDDELKEILKQQPELGSTIKKFKENQIEINLNGADCRSHENLSAIECKRRDIHSIKGNHAQPTIKLGSIIEQELKIENETIINYYICMQPLCDTVRIRDDCNFIFLKIKKVEENAKFTHVIKNAHDSFLKFNIKPSSKELYTFTFSHDTNTNTIKTIEEEGQFKVKYKKTRQSDREGCLAG